MRIALTLVTGLFLVQVSSAQARALQQAAIALTTPGQAWGGNS